MKGHLPGEVVAADEARRLADDQMTEAELSEQVRQLFKLFGWWAYHTHRSEHSEAGFPDWVAVRDTRLLFAELKRQRARMPRKQQEIITRLGRTQAEVYVWRPSDLDHIVEILR